MNGDQSHLCVSKFLSLFNFDCGFTHVSHTWPDRKFNGELNGSCCKVIESMTIELSFVKVYKGFACFLTEKLFSRIILASPVSVRVKP